MKEIKKQTHPWKEQQIFSDNVLGLNLFKCLSTEAGDKNDLGKVNFCISCWNSFFVLDPVMMSGLVFWYISNFCTMEMKLRGFTSFQ